MFQGSFEGLWERFRDAYEDSSAFDAVCETFQGVPGGFKVFQVHFKG